MTTTRPRVPVELATAGRRFGYDLDRTLADIRPSYSFDVSCQGSVLVLRTARLSLLSGGSLRRSKKSESPT